MFTNSPRGSITADDLTIDILALEDRRVYGRTEYLVTPTAGSGEKWVQSQRITWTVPPVAPAVSA